MKKKGMLNDAISLAIARMGHTDTMVVCDAGLPIPDGPERIDVAIKSGLPDFISTLEAILEELCVQKVYIAKEMQVKNEGLYKYIKDKFSNIEIVEISHEELKEMSKASKAIVRTGEFAPYANIILESGVVF